jgi:hypothetical protein
MAALRVRLTSAPMSKPDRAQPRPSNELARFTDSDDRRAWAARLDQPRDPVKIHGRES